jgi:hypothetical protein
MLLSRFAGVRTLILLLSFACAAGAAAGVAGAAAAAGDPAPQGCGRFTLEKIPLDATQAQVEALGIGKLEPVLVGTEESRFHVRPPKTKKEIELLLFHGRVRDITLLFHANAATADTALAELRGRWGEPDKPAETDKLTGAWAKSIKVFSWSDRSCPAYGAFVSTGFDVRIILSTSVNRVRYLGNERPEDAR